MAENKEPTFYNVAPRHLFWDVNRVGMQNEYKLGQLYASLPKPTEQDFQEFKRLNPELADGIEKRDKMREIQNTGSIATAGVLGVSMFAYATKLKAGLVPSLILGVLSGGMGRVIGKTLFREVGFWTSGADQVKFSFPHDPERAYARWWRLKNKVPLPGYTAIQAGEDVGVKL